MKALLLIMLISSLKYLQSNKSVKAKTTESSFNIFDLLINQFKLTIRAYQEKYEEFTYFLSDLKSILFNNDGDLLIHQYDRSHKDQDESKRSYYSQEKITPLISNEQTELSELTENINYNNNVQLFNNNNKRSLIL